MPVGKVKWFNDQKGYGFIEQGDGGQDVFVHYSVIASPGYKTLVEGQEVQYEVYDEGRGPRAKSVTPIGGAPEEAPEPAPEVPAVE